MYVRSLRSSTSAKKSIDLLKGAAFMVEPQRKQMTEGTRIRITRKRVVSCPVFGQRLAQTIASVVMVTLLQSLYWKGTSLG